MIQFNQIPLDIRTPGSFAEIDSSRAERGVARSRHRVLLIGQRHNTAAAAAPTRIRTVQEAINVFGRGSQLGRMFAAFKSIDPDTETWGLPLPADNTGVQATGTLTFTGPATAAGTLALYIGGQQVLTPVAAGQANTVIATNVAAAINAYVNSDIPVDAEAVAAVVTLTARDKGLWPNDLDIRLNYFPEDATPAGVGVAIVAMSGGTVNPSISTIWATIGDDDFDTFVLGFNDTANILSAETEMTARWGPMRARDGLIYAAAAGSYGTLAAKGAARNSSFGVIAGLNKSPTPPYEVAAALAAAAGLSLAIDPARPLTGLAVPWIKAPAIADRLTRAERDLLLHDGISTFTVNRAGQVLIERVITTYQLDPQGLESIAFLDITTLATLSALRFSARAWVARKFARMKLADDGQQAGRQRNVATPSRIKASLIGWAQREHHNGLIENVDTFAKQVRVQRDETDPNRVNCILPPDLVNQLLVTAMQVQFRL